MCQIPIKMLKQHTIPNSSLHNLGFIHQIEIFLEEGIIFSGNLSAGTDLAINFDLVKCITKNKYT